MGSHRDTGLIISEDNNVELANFLKGQENWVVPVDPLGLLGVSS